MLIDLHAHTSRFSKCSFLDPVSLVKGIRRKGLQGVVITEHHYQWSDEALLQLRKECEVEETFLLFSGQEVETEIGHVVVLGAQDTIEEKITVAEIRKEYPAAVLIWAHPFRNNKIPASSELNNADLDAIEIFTSNHTVQENCRALSAWHRIKFVAVSGSDSHGEDTIGMFPTQFDHPVATIEELVEEIKNGRARPFLKEIPKAGSNVVATEVTIGAKGDTEQRQRIIIKKYVDKKKWQRQEKTLWLTNKLGEKGFNEGQFRVPKTIDINSEEYTIIEEGQRGKCLYDLLLHVKESVGIRYIELTAQWLAKLHNLRLKESELSETISNEERKINHYERAFFKAKSPFYDDIHDIAEVVKEQERSLLKKDGVCFTQLHGDFHLKNIIIGQDFMQDMSTVYVSVIDFGSTMYFSPLFDVGYFLAQLRNQLRFRGDLLSVYDENVFIDAYAQSACCDVEEIREVIALFKLRAFLSVGAYLVKVGKGISADMDALIFDLKSICSNMKC